MGTAFSSSPRLRVILSAFAGLFAYGSWAIFINGGLQAPEAWRAGFVQGLYSFFVTFFFTSSIEWSLQHLKFYPKTLTFSVSSLILFFLSYSVHLVNATPRPLATLLPSYLLSVLLTLIYVIGIDSLDKKKT